MDEEQTSIDTETENVPAVSKTDKPVQLRTEVLPERQWAAVNIGDPLPAVLIERVGQLAITDEQAAVLAEPVPDDEIDIIGDSGLAYVSHEYIRRQLNRAFRPMGWTMIEVSPFRPGPTKGTPEWYQKWAMLVQGVLAGVSMSAAKYDPDNRRQNLTDVYETIKSDCVRRIAAKDLGLGLEIWNRRRAIGWRSTFCLEVKVRYKGEIKTWWRRHDSEPFRDFNGNSIELASAPAQAPPKPPAAPAPPAPPSKPAPQPPAAASRPVRVVPEPLPEEPEMPAPPKPASPPLSTGSSPITQGQVNLLLMWCRKAGLLNGDDATQAQDWFARATGIDEVVSDGKTSTENLIAQIRQLPGKRVTEVKNRLEELAKESQV